MRKIITALTLTILFAFTLTPVFAVSATAIDVNDFEKTMTVGSSQTISVVVYPDDAEDEVRYSSSNTSVATISPGGKIEAVSKGTTTITVSVGSVSKSMKLTVAVATRQISVNSTYVTLKKGQTYKLKASVSPSGATQNISYSSSDTSVVKVNNSGRIKAVGNGDASVFVSNGDLSESVTVIVNSNTSGSGTIDFVSDNDEEIAKKISTAEAETIIMKAKEDGFVSTMALKALKETGRTFVLEDEEYNLIIKGNDIINCDNSFSDKLLIIRDNGGIHFEINNGNPLPGRIQLQLKSSELKELKYIYLKDENSEKQQFLGTIVKSKLTIDMEGTYYLTYEEIGRYKIKPLFIAISSGVAIILIGVYVLVRRRYWFW